MQIDTETYLDLVEASKKLACVDIEATGLKGDYNSVLCVSFKPFGDKPYTFTVKRPGDDRELVREVKRELEKYHCWVTYYGLGFDIPMLNTRLFVAGSKPILPRHHIDMYWKLKSKLLLARRSQAHILRIIGGLEQKMDVSAEQWNKVLANPKKELPLMRARCESDVSGLEALYKRSKHLIKAVECR